MQRLTLALALTLPALAGCDGGDTTDASRAAAPTAAAPATQVAASPAKFSPQQPPNLVAPSTALASVETRELKSLEALRAAAAELEAKRPEFYAALWSLAPGQTRNGIPRFVGTDHHDPDAALVFAMRLLDEGQPPESRGAIADVLARTGGPHARIDALLFTTEQDPSVRALLVSNLAKLPIADAGATLRAAFADPHPEVRLAAARASAHQSQIDASIRDALLAQLDDADPAVQLEAVRSLGSLKVVEALDPIAARVSSGDSKLRVQALRALSRIDPAYLNKLDLAGLSNDPDEQVAREATRLRGNPTR